MSDFNSFVDVNIPKMKNFIDSLCEKVSVVQKFYFILFPFAHCLQGRVVTEKYSSFDQLANDTWLEKELAMAAVHVRKCKDKWFDENVCFFVSFLFL